MKKGMALGIVRHLLTTAGGALVAKGVLDAGLMSTGVGSVVTIATIAWSIYQKYQANKKLKAAVAPSLDVTVGPSPQAPIPPCN